MEYTRHMKTNVWILLAVLTVFAGDVSAVTPSAEADHVPDEILVKFRSPMANRLRSQLATNTSPQKVKLSRNLDRMNQACRLQEIRPLFGRLKPDGTGVPSGPQKIKTLGGKKGNPVLRRRARADRKAAPFPSQE